MIISMASYANCISGDCKNGYGTYKLKSGAIYKGEFKDGKPSGIGLIKTKKGICKSYWINGQQHGKAIWKLNSGNKLYCHYENGKKHGKGKLVNEEGKLLAFYLWKNGKLIKKKTANDFKKEKEVEVETPEIVMNGKREEEQVESSVEENDLAREEEIIEEPEVELMPGTMVSFWEKYSYNTGDGSLFGNLLGSYLTADYNIKFYGVVEQKLGDRYKITVTNAQIVDPSWASVNYFEYKPYAIQDMNQKVGNVVFMTSEEVDLED